MKTLCAAITLVLFTTNVHAEPQAETTCNGSKDRFLFPFVMKHNHSVKVMINEDEVPTSDFVFLCPGNDCSQGGVVVLNSKCEKGATLFVTRKGR